MRLLTSQESRGDIVVSFVICFRLFCHVNILLVLLPHITRIKRWHCCEFCGLLLSFLPCQVTSGTPPSKRTTSRKKYGCNYVCITSHDANINVDYVCDLWSSMMTYCMDGAGAMAKGLGLNGTRKRSPDTLGYGGPAVGLCFRISCYLALFVNVKCSLKREITLIVIIDFSLMSNRKYLKLADGLVSASEGNVCFRHLCAPVHMLMTQSQCLLFCQLFSTRPLLLVFHFRYHDRSPYNQYQVGGSIKKEFSRRLHETCLSMIV